MTKELSQWIPKSVDDVLQSFSTSLQGLSHQEGEQRLIKYGPNKVVSSTFSPISIFIRQFSSPFLYLLFAASFISFLLKQFDDGIVILLFISINAILGFYQEFKSEKTAALLQEYIERTATVIREGKEQSIGVTKLVPGDMLKIIPGDIFPADVRLIQTTNLQVDESVVTGESIAVTKNETTANIGLAATTILSGEGLGVVIATGNTSSYGAIAALTTKTKRTSTFQLRIERLSKFTLIIVSATLVLVFILNILLHESYDLIELAIFSVALAVSVIPEGLPVVTTFSLSLGALHLAKKHVVVKRLSAIEDVGAIEILCSDKTGTLTENSLRLADVISTDKNMLLFYARAIAEKSKRHQYHGNNSFGEAILKYKIEDSGFTMHETGEILKELPFDPKRKRTTKLLKQGKTIQLITMGAPEAILSLTSLTDTAKKSVTADVTRLGTEGKRVLAVAYKSAHADYVHTDLEHLERNLIYGGLLAFEDPIKPTTKQAIIKAERLGIQIKLLTGDSKEVAGHVAHSVGLISDPRDVITGETLEAMPEHKRKEAVTTHHVFARVTPEQKYHIIEMLKSSHSVGFLGEGINDAPALKIADVAMVVAEASDIAREASDIILLQKSLSVIVDGITEGRKVFANTSKYILATFSANFGNFFAVATSSLLINTLPLLPIHILLLNLLSDFPMISISTDHVDTQDIAKPTQFHIHRFVTLALVLGIVSTFFDFVFFGVFVKQGTGVLQNAWFMGSILTELLFLFSIRTNRFFLKAVRPSTPVIILSGLAALATICIPNFSITQQLFHFSPIPPTAFLTVGGIILTYLAATEGVKLLYFHFDKEKV